MRFETYPLASPEGAAWHLLFDEIGRGGGWGGGSHVLTHLVRVLGEGREAVLLPDLIFPVL